ncbi:hypothetical protein ABE65_010770 [Fictibacillus phosphorivorans]|uniref:DUF3626 domain-containing protein n=1 Tax=Fictibacillus phosphorivorans TaxID=1221500 RepID=A0A160IS39_9BACL|nr:DUF3626 domain-containing protein [Fictibacillus phosphorivorans]ANC79364.1 hypothetical protein ABE65_010770 [Fictibacillus phosphorivorans]
MKLTQAQQLAIEYVERYASQHKDDAQATIQHIIRMANIPDDVFRHAILKLKEHARIALHFHPDRPNSSMINIAEALYQDGIYKSQFETLLSNGSVSAYPGGLRDQWEEQLFGGAYQIEGTTLKERAKYGALNIMNHADGPAPRFGSCYFLLKPEVSKRATFTYLDSHQNPKEKGTFGEFDMILAALLEEIFTRDFALGEPNLMVSSLIRYIVHKIEVPFEDPAVKQVSRNLNHYIEAQVHGDVSLKEDVDILVADPSFIGTKLGQTLTKLCAKYNVKLYFHRGFQMSVDQVPSDFRGADMPSLAKRIAKNQMIDAHLVGEAVMELRKHPEIWSDRGTNSEVLQELKLLWHILVKYGNPHLKK